MADQLFREKSLKKINSPEELNDYLKVASPSVWLILTAVIILLVGAFLWSFFGKIETTVDCLAISENNEICVYLNEEYIQSVKDNSIVKINDKEYQITSISEIPFFVDGNLFTDYEMHVGNLQEGMWVYKIVIKASLKEGIYTAKFVTERIKPINLLFN